MIFWTIALALAAAAAALVALTLLRGHGQARAAEYDLRVYRDQLAEVERDLARGTLPEAEAERARIEISRRILEADRAAGASAGTTTAPKPATFAMGAVAGLFLIAGAAALYARLGAPQYPDMPLQARIAMADELRRTRPSQALAEQSLGTPVTPEVTDPQYLELIARLRAVVAERPDDIQGLTFLAQNEAAIGNHAAAYRAQAQLIAAKGDTATAQDHAMLAEMMIVATGGYVSPEAEAALTATLARDMRNGSARYYSGLLFAQVGRPDLAFRFWQALLAEGPPDAPWIPPIRAQIEAIAQAAGQHNFTLPPEAAPRGPTEDQMRAAQDMDPKAQSEMIRGMVAGLAERLATEGGPASDWARLIRAYGVLGEADSIAPVVTEARTVFAGDPAALAEIDAAARDAGLGP